MKSLSYRIAIFLVVLSLLTGPVAPAFAQEGTPVIPTETPIEEVPTVTSTETPLPAILPTETAAATETPTPSVTETASVTPATEVVETVPILSLSTDPAFLTRSETVNLLWSLEGISLEFGSLVLQISLPQGFTADKKIGAFDEATRILSIPVTTLEGSIELKVKKVVTDSIFTASVSNEKEILASASIILPLFEQLEVSKSGGKIDTMKGKVKITFPEGALTEDVLINAGFPSMEALPENYSAHVFELRAYAKEEKQESGKQEKKEIKHFDQPLTIEVDYSDLTLTEEQERELYLYWYNEETGDWHALESYRDPQTKTLTAKSDHFTVFDIGVNDWRATRLPTVDSFQVSQFTGAATYSLPIEVPPGPGGFQPNVVLSYNSQVVDQATTKTQASWVGMGWSMDGGGSISEDGSTDGYQLEVNGVSTLLHQEVSGGEYHAVDENFWRIVHVETSTENYWQVSDTKGNQYFFEQAAIYAPALAYKWYLTRAVNPFGQEMTYHYTLQTKVVSGVTTTTAAYLNKITYSHGRYRILFNREARTDYTAAWDTDSAFHLYEKTRLNVVRVEQDANGDGTFETIIRKYNFTYALPTDTDIIWPGVTYTAGTDKTATLKSVQEISGSGNHLPAHTFTYDGLHLIKVENGYGGSVEFDYEDVPWYNATTPAAYEKTGTVCADGSSILPWVIRAGSEQVNCSATIGWLLVKNGAVTTPYYTHHSTLTENQLVRPGGVYQIDFNATQTAGSTIKVGFHNGTSDQTQNGDTATIVLANDADTARAVFKSVNGTGRFNSVTIKLLPSYYRVENKIIRDRPDINDPHSYTYHYDYSDPLVAGSDYEYRGNKFVTEIAPNGNKTTTQYYQDDARKGRVKSITTFDASDVMIQQTVNDYQYTSLPEYPVSNRFIHAWIYLASQINRIYNTSGAVAGGTKTVYTYDPSYGNVIQILEFDDPTGTGLGYRTTTFNYFYKDTSNLYLVSLPADKVIYDSTGTPVSETLYYYNGSNNNLVAPTANKLTKIRTLMASGQYSQVDYGYDVYGNQTSQTSYTGFSNGTSTPSGAQTSTTVYDTTYHTYPTSISNALSQPTSLTYDYTLSVPLTQTDPNGAITKADYDSFGRIIGIHKPNPDATGYEIDASLTMFYTNSYPFTTTVTQEDMGYSVVQKHDGMGRVFQTIAGGVITDTIYDSPTVTKQSVPYEGTPPTPQLYTTTTVDPLARTTTVLAPDGTQTTTSTNGLVTTFTDALDRTTTTTNDVWGRTIMVTPPTGPIMEYGYDELGNLLTVERGGVTATLTYNNAGQKLTMDDPDMGDWSYTYDALGNLKTQTDARTCLLTMSYDPLNRLTGKTSSGTGCSTQVSTAYTYDSGTNGIGHRTGMTDASGSTAWTYDKRGRLIQETKTISSVNYMTGWGYNNADLNTTITYPDGEVVTNDYDARMLLDSVSSSLGGYYVDSTTYDSAGRIDQRDLGNSLMQNFDYYDWDEQISLLGGQGGRLKNITTGTLQNLDYSYDKVGNIKKIFSNADGILSTTDDETQEYGYDSLDRLTDWTLNGGTPETYEYDLVTGNLREKANVDLEYNDSAHAHAVSDYGSTNSYDYDANGNQITRVIGADTFNLSYDAENRLVEVKKNTLTIAAFTYDGDGKRVIATENSMTTLFIGSHYEVTNPGSGQTVTKYYFAGTSRIAMRKYTVPSSMSVEYLLGDHLGSTSITTDNAGAKVSEMRYTPWGEVRFHWTATQTTTPAYYLADYTFTGQYSYMDDPSTGATEGFGLMFYNARMYDPALGRFTSADSIVPTSQGVQAYDRYAYVSNNPVRYADPSGHGVDCGIGMDCGGSGGNCGACGSGSSTGSEDGGSDALPTTSPTNTPTNNYACNGSINSGYATYCENGVVKIDLRPATADLIPGEEYTYLNNGYDSRYYIFNLDHDEVHYLINNLLSGCVDCSEYWQFARSEIDIFGFIGGEINPVLGAVSEGYAIGNDSNLKTIARNLDQLTFKPGANGQITSATIGVISPVTRTDTTWVSPNRVTESLYQIQGMDGSIPIPFNSGSTLIGLITNAIYVH